MGSPPPDGSKKLVLNFRSVNNIVKPPANTGKANNNKKAVINIDHTNKDNLTILKFPFIFIIVVIKFIAPKIELKPAICKEKIAKSIDTPLWNKFLVKGGYTVQPAPTPPPDIIEHDIKKIEGINNQNVKFFARGNAISGILINKGINQLPKPPIITGITKKKSLLIHEK